MLPVRDNLEAKEDLFDGAPLSSLALRAEAVVAGDVDDASEEDEDEDATTTELLLLLTPAIATLELLRAPLLISAVELVALSLAELAAALCVAAISLDEEWTERPFVKETLEGVDGLSMAPPPTILP